MEPENKKIMETEENTKMYELSCYLNQWVFNSSNYEMICETFKHITKRDLNYFINNVYIKDEEELLFILSKKPSDDDLSALIKSFDLHSRMFKAFKGILKYNIKNDFKIIVKQSNGPFYYKILNINTNEYYF
jgi:hypothetical protein